MQFNERGLYDALYRRMDEWLDGRWGLDYDWRVNSCFTDSLNHHTVKKMKRCVNDIRIISRPHYRL